MQQYGDVVWRTAWRLLRNDADVRDCFQETFISAMEAGRRGEIRNWPGLLQRIATARALDLLRKQKSYKLFVSQSDHDAVTQAADPVRQVLDSELMDQLRAALRELPSQQSEIFCLRHLNEMSYEEISAEMGLSVDHVGVLLHRARGRLRELLVSEDIGLQQNRKVNHV